MSCPGLTPPLVESDQGAVALPLHNAPIMPYGYPHHHARYIVHARPLGATQEIIAE